MIALQSCITLANLRIIVAGAWWARGGVHQIRGNILSDPSFEKLVLGEGRGGLLRMEMCKFKNCNQIMIQK